MLSLICLSEAVYLSSAQFPWWLQAQLSVPGVRYRRSKDQRKGWQAFFVRGGESLIDGCLPLSGRIIRRHGQDRRWSPGANSSGVVSAISRQTLFPGVCKENYDIDFFEVWNCWCRLLLSARGKRSEICSWCDWLLKLPKLSAAKQLRL